MPSKKDPSETVEESGAAPVDTALVRELATILTETGLSEIEVERGEMRIRVARELTVAAAPLAATAAPVAAAQPAAAAAEASLAPPSPPAGDVVKSPMVGTVYLSPQPGTPPFVKAGERVTEGQTLMIIEAMKTMNPIPSPRAGVVVELLAQDGQPVEFGEGLLVLE